MKYKFVDYIPKELQPDTVYVSMENETVVHSCVCGCGGRVVTPLSPVGWRITFDGESISLYPSIGNWNLECKSHYWIRNNHIIWAERWSDEHIEAARDWNLAEKERFYSDRRSDLTENEEKDETKDA